MTKAQKENILAGFIQKIQSIDCNQKPNKIIKDIDKLTHQCYIDLFTTFDNKKSVNDFNNTKHGHCC